MWFISHFSTYDRRMEAGPNVRCEAAVNRTGIEPCKVESLEAVFEFVGCGAFRLDQRQCNSGAVIEGAT